MIGPPGLEEPPAYRRTLGAITFCFFCCLKHSAPQVSPLSGKTLFKRSALKAQHSSLQDIPTQILIIYNIF
jgi:hypothetical protein